MQLRDNCFQSIKKLKYFSGTSVIFLWSFLLCAWSSLSLQVLHHLLKKHYSLQDCIDLWLLFILPASYEAWCNTKPMQSIYFCVVNDFYLVQAIQFMFSMDHLPFLVHTDPSVSLCGSLHMELPHRHLNKSFIMQLFSHFSVYSCKQAVLHLQKC